jgi:hypothetical protein
VVVNVGLATGFSILLLLRPAAGPQVISAMPAPAVPFSVVLWPSLMVLFPPALTTGGGIMLTVIGLLAAAAGVTQVALLVTVQLTTSLPARVLLVNMGLFVPTSVLFICHW